MTPAHTIDAVAELLGVSTRTVQEWATSGELRAISVSRTRSSRKPRLRILDTDLQAFLAGRAVGAESSQPQRRSGRHKEIKRYV